MFNAVEIGIIAFCLAVLSAMLIWAFFYRHAPRISRSHKRQGRHRHPRDPRHRARTAGRPHDDVEMHPRNWSPKMDDEVADHDLENQVRNWRSRVPPPRQHTDVEQADDWPSETWHTVPL